MGWDWGWQWRPRGVGRLQGYLGPEGGGQDVWLVPLMAWGHWTEGDASRAGLSVSRAELEVALSLQRLRDAEAWLSPSGPHRAVCAGHGPGAASSAVVGGASPSVCAEGAEPAQAGMGRGRTSRPGKQGVSWVRNPRTGRGLWM